MDPRDRADAALARARARNSLIVTPDDAVSPMDAAATVQIPRSVVAAAEDDNADNTQQIHQDVARGGAAPRPPYQQQGYEQPYDQGYERNHNQGYGQNYEQQHYNSGYDQGYQQGYDQGQQHTQPYGHQPPPEPEQPAPREVTGLVPTVQQPGAHRSLLSRRLDGSD
jgi:hypothetical protein